MNSRGHSKSRVCEVQKKRIVIISVYKISYGTKEASRGSNWADNLPISSFITLSVKKKKENIM